MNSPRVSVLMAVFNTGAYVAAAIDSVLDQTLTELELIVVDDASTDDSWAIVSAAAARDRRIVALRRERQGGASAALNLALSHARAPYITRQDSDDMSLPVRLVEQMRFLDAHPAVAAVGTSAVTVDGDGNALEELRLPATNSDIQAALLDQMCFCGPTVMVRRTAFEKIGFHFDESVSGSEDYELCLRLAEVGELANLPEPLYLYRQHASSVSHRDRYRQLLRKASALERAIHRRAGGAAPRTALATVARDYLRAAVIGHGMGQRADTRECLHRALALDPALLENVPLLKQIVGKYAPSSTAEALTFIDSLFDEVFPHSPRLNRLRRELLAGHHIKEAFAGDGVGDADRIRRHLVPAIAARPAWLANRGVLSMLVRQLFGRRAGLLAAGALSVAGMVVLLAMTRLGIGTSPDSVHYIRAARQIVDGGVGALTGGGEVTTSQFAPLYSFVLASAGLLGVDPYHGARWVNAVLFAINIFLVGFLVFRTTTHVRWLCIIGSFVTLASVPLLSVHASALSEPAFLPLCLLGCYLVARYLETGRQATLLAAAASVGLAFAARYAGAACVITGGIAILFFNVAPFRQRMRDAALFGLISSLPMAAWMLRNVTATSTVANREIAFHPIGARHVWEAFYTASGWLLIPPAAPDALRFAVWIALAIAAAASVGKRWTSRGATPAGVAVLTLFVVVYAAFLATSISFVDANTPLDDRVLLPVFAAGLIVLLHWADRFWPTLIRTRVLAYATSAALLLFGMGHAVNGVTVVAASYERGWGFSSAAWQQSPTLAQVRQLSPDLPIYSNAPEIVYLHTGRPARALPKKTLLMSRQPNPDYERQLAEASRALEGACGVVVYFRNLPEQKSAASEQELTARLALHVRAAARDGAISSVNGCRAR